MARQRGLLGPGPVAPQISHGLAFAEAAQFEQLVAGRGTPSSRLLAADLGSGGGLPGLVLAFAGPEALRWVLIDSRRRSTEFLEEAVAQLRLQHRVEIVLARAEEMGREPARRGRFDVVVARGFGPAPVTAECGAPLLVVGGRLVVSEPPVPATGERWPAGPLDRLGLVLVGQVALAGGHFAVLEQVKPCPTTYPRRTGIPAKRPLYRVKGGGHVSRETPPGA